MYFNSKFVAKRPIDNKSSLVQVMAWRQAIAWTNVDAAPWCIYAALRGDELDKLTCEQNGGHSADDILQCIFMKEN